MKAPMAQNLPHCKCQWASGQLSNPGTNRLITTYTVVASTFIDDLHELCREPALPKFTDFRGRMGRLQTRTFLGIRPTNSVHHGRRQ